MNIDIKKISLKDLINDEGIDVIVAFLIITIISNKVPYLTTLLFLYGYIRSFWIKSLTIPITYNILSLFFLINLGINSTILNYHYIVHILVAKVIILILSLIQSFSIIIRCFNYEVINDIKVKNKICRFVIRTIIRIDKTIKTINILIAVIYPILISIVIILSFSIIYNTSNSFYEECNIYDKGIFNSESVSRLSTNCFNNSVVGKDEFFELYKNGYIYFSAVTYFTIGYGDILPKGDSIRLICVIQMVLAHSTNIYFFAIYSSLFYDFIKNRHDKKSNQVEKVNSIT